MLDTLQQNQKSDTQKSRTFFGSVSVILTGLGGLAVMFITFGYIAITCFLSSVKLYGLANFPIQFYREALIGLLSDTVGFYYKADLYLNHWYMVLLTITILLIPLMHNKQKILNFSKEIKLHVFLKKILGALFFVFVIFVLLVTWKPDWFTIDTGSTIKFTELIFFTVCIPVLISLFIYLYLNFKKNVQRFEHIMPYKTMYGIFFLSFILLFISIPVGYGSAIYDIYLYEVELIECEKVHLLRKPSGDGFDLLYLMGHTSGREIFCYPTDIPPRLILVDRNAVKSIIVKHEREPIMSIRKLFSRSKVPDVALVLTEDLNEKDQRQWFEGE